MTQEPCGGTPGNPRWVWREKTIGMTAGNRKPCPGCLDCENAGLRELRERIAELEAKAERYQRALECAPDPAVVSAEPFDRRYSTWLAETRRDFPQQAKDGEK